MCFRQYSLNAIKRFVCVMETSVYCAARTEFVAEPRLVKVKNYITLLEQAAMIRAIIALC
jgi:hypothetical protein